MRRGKALVPWCVCGRSCRHSAKRHLRSGLEPSMRNLPTVPCIATQSFNRAAFQIRKFFSPSCGTLQHGRWPVYAQGSALSRNWIQVADEPAFGGRPGSLWRSSPGLPELHLAPIVLSVVRVLSGDERVLQIWSPPKPAARRPTCSLQFAYW